MGIAEIHLNVFVNCEGRQCHKTQCPQTTTFEEIGEPKLGLEPGVRPLTSQTAKAKPTRAFFFFSMHIILKFLFCTLEARDRTLRPYAYQPNALPLRPNWLKHPPPRFVFGGGGGCFGNAHYTPVYFLHSGGGFTAPINYYRQMLWSENFLSPRKSDYSLVSRPTLIVWGDQDQALETPLATLSSKLSVQGGATVSVVEGASHWVQMDRPDLVNKYMRDFLAWR